MLGPLEVVSDGRVIDLGGSKQRATLGFLLLQPNRAVPVSSLLTALWDVGEAPVTARKILQNAVWGLRRTLTSEGASAGVALRTRPPGYALEVDPEHIDLHRFRRLVEEGRSLLGAGRRDEAARRLREALRLWRGTALSDLVEVGLDWRELTALQNIRLDVLEEYFEAELDCGRHYSVLPEIETVVQAEPLRERPCGQLMRALYRCGRQADALGVYSRLRASLARQLGLEPGRELRLLHQAILTHDPALEFTPPASPLVPSTTVPTALGVPVAADAGDHQKPAVADADRSPARRPAQREVGTPPRVGVNLRVGRPNASDAVSDRMDSRIRQGTESRGGTVGAAMGTDSPGALPARQGTAGRATGAAAAVRTVRAPTGSAPGDGAAKAAIVTGEALMRHSAREGVGLSLPADGALPRRGQAMPLLVPDAEVEVVRQDSGGERTRLFLRPARRRPTPPAATARRAGEGVGLSLSADGALPRRGQAMPLLVPDGETEVCPQD
ncbi:AfsR/SARP family transcriptional regulator [Streptomyces rameus]